MKVAVIMPLAEQRGGAEMALLHLMQHGQLPEVAWQVIFLEDGPMIAQVQRLGVQTHLVPAGRLRAPNHFCATVARIAALARRENVDFLLSWMAKPHLYGSLAARLAGVPALWYQHGTSDGNWMDRAATRLPARGILACSHAAATAQARLRPLRPVRVVHPGAELARFDPLTLPRPDEARRRLGLSAAGPLIGIVGRLQRWKGIHTLIEAMPSILQKFPETRVVIVGGAHALEQDYPDYLHRRIAALTLTDRVFMAGLQRNIPEWMQAMDVIVHASDKEPFGIVIVEAMALGKPIVAGDAGGPTEIITDGVHGLLTPYEDAAALARAILRCLDDPDLAARLGAAAQQRAAEFSTQRYAQNVVTAIRELGAVGAETLE